MKLNTNSNAKPCICTSQVDIPTFHKQRLAGKDILMAEAKFTRIGSKCIKSGTKRMGRP